MKLAASQEKVAGPSTFGYGNQQASCVLSLGVTKAKASLLSSWLMKEGWYSHRGQLEITKCVPRQQDNR